MSQETISLVVPCYNEEATIEIFYHEVLKYEKQMPAQLEFCFVDDGSEDRTIAILRKLAAQDSRVHYVSFSRNFGKEAGLYAGLELATGDYVATMDVDLQDPPYLLPEMYRIVKEEGYDCVATKRSTRKGEPVVRSFFARMFYRIINRMSDTEIVDGARDYRFMSRQMVNAIIKMANITVSLKESSHGLALTPNGCLMKILNVQQGKPNGHSGAYLNTLLKVFWLIQQCRFISLHLLA